MSILNMWREARGNVLRNEFEDAIARIRNPNESAKRAFLNNVHQTIGHLRETNGPATARDRKALLKQSRKSTIQMWDHGDWPSALGLIISCLNIESEFVPGEDAAYVKG